MDDDDVSKAMERLGINEEAAKVIRDGKAPNPLSRTYTFWVPKGAKPWGKGRLFDPFADSIEKLKKARVEFADTFREMASVAAGVLGGAAGQGQMDPLSGEASAHRLGEFGGEVGNDGMARFPAPRDAHPRELKIILYRDAVVMRVRGVEKTYSYREAGLHDRNKTKSDKRKENRFYDFVAMILAGGGSICWGEKSWPGKDDRRTRFRRSSRDPDIIEETDVMAPLNGPCQREKTTKKDFQNRLRLITGLRGEFFHDYAEVGGYKPCFTLMDHRQENVPQMGPCSGRLADTGADDVQREKDEKLLRDAAAEAEQWQKQRRGRGASRSDHDQ